MIKNFITKKISRSNEFNKVSYIDKIAIEEPLQIILEHATAEKYQKENLVITMRTPGHDELLSIGFLFSERIIQSIDEIQHYGHIGILEQGAKARNRFLVTLHKDVCVQLDQQKRNTISSSSCGICGKTQIESILRTYPDLENRTQEKQVDEKFIYGLLDIFNQEHKKFDQTGAMHAAAIFNHKKEMTHIAFDVGRHNALDKIIGEKCIQKKLPVLNDVLFLSGRVSYELTQKAINAGFRSIIALGAPTSLAIELAEEANIYLIGFLKNNQMNIYNG